MAEINNEELDLFLKDMMGSLSFENLTNLVDMFAYQGYDTATIIKNFINRGVAKYVAAGMSKKDALAKVHEDLNTLLVVFLTRGTQITGKLANKSSEVAKKKLLTLQATYNIKAPSKGSQYSSEDLTMARIASAFASKTFTINMSAKVSREVGDIPKGMHKALCFTGGASIIPQGKEWDGVYDAWLQWSAGFDMVVNQRKGDPLDKVNIENAAKYGDIMRRNTFYKEPARKTLMAQADISPKDFPALYVHQ